MLFLASTFCPPKKQHQPVQKMHRSHTLSPSRSLSFSLFSLPLSLFLPMMCMCLQKAKVINEHWYCCGNQWVMSFVFQQVIFLWTYNRTRCSKSNFLLKLFFWGKIWIESFSNFYLTFYGDYESDVKWRAQSKWGTLKSTSVCEFPLFLTLTLCILVYFL